jgi:hypothetical protein
VIAIPPGFRQLRCRRTIRSTRCAVAGPGPRPAPGGVKCFDRVRARLFCTTSTCSQPNTAAARARFAPSPSPFRRLRGGVLLAEGGCPERQRTGGPWTALAFSAPRRRAGGRGRVQTDSVHPALGLPHGIGRAGGGERERGRGSGLLTVLQLAFVRRRAHSAVIDGLVAVHWCDWLALFTSLGIRP